MKANGSWTTAHCYDATGDITRPDYVIYEWKRGDDGRPTYAQKQ